ncbi:MAG: hypothetical protein CVU89_15935 [Firmicutes bacterium HGW-Firmicutes-14]|nr:MAG: hypothetical protein CVU89_15935 [Firmicutes bacterium HGW-Firmicutes-14]
MNRRAVAFILLAILIVFCSGCWDLLDISERAFVSGMALDLAGDREHPAYKVTVIIWKPIRIREQSFETVTNSFTVEAPTLTKAFQKLQTKISRHISFFHLRIVLIGEKLASRDTRDIVDFIEKSPEIALRTRFAFIRDEKPNSIIKANPSFERSIAGELANLVHPDKRLGLMKSTNYLTLVRELDESKGTALGTEITIEEDDSETIPVSEGAAVIKDWKLAGWLNGEETQAANWFNGGPTAVIEGKLDGGTFSYFVDNKSARIEPIIDGNQLRFKVKIKTIGLILEEKLKQKDLSKPKTLARLEKEFARVIERQVNNAIEKSQNEFEADYLGFGRALKSSFPEVYDRIKWQEVYPKVPIWVNVEAKISRYGIAN